MQQVNFLPPSYLQRQARRQRTVRQTGLLVLLAVSLVMWWAVQEGQTLALRYYARTLQGQVEAARLRASEMTRLREEHRLLMHQIKVQRELAPSVRHTQVVGALAEVTPAPVALTSLRMKTERDRQALPAGGRGNNATASHASDRAGQAHIRIELSGLAPDDMTVANFLTALKDHPLFVHVKMRYSRTTELFDVVGRQFEIEMRVPLDRRYEPAEVKEGVARAD